MRKKITLGVICLAVMLGAISFSPGVMLRLFPPEWAVMSRTISQDSLAIGELAERMAQALYDADQKTAAQIAVSLQEKTSVPTADVPQCLAEAAASQAEYYGLIHQSSGIVLDAIERKSWEQLITAGELLLQAEEVSGELANAILSLEPSSCD